MVGSAALSSATLRAALRQPAGSASTAAAPLLQALLPALTAIANAAATAFYYIAQLVAFLTGKSIGASKSSAKAMGKYAKAAKSAGAQRTAHWRSSTNWMCWIKTAVAAVREPSPRTTTLTQTTRFLTKSCRPSNEADCYGVGQLIGEKLRDSLNAIPWPDIQDKARAWATNIANCINGFIEVPGLWEAIGHTVAQGLNTALIFADTLMQGIHWDSLAPGSQEAHHCGGRT